jgi:hypothetical protein
LLIRSFTGAGHRRCTARLALLEKSAADERDATRIGTNGLASVDWHFSAPFSRSSMLLAIAGMRMGQRASGSATSSNFHLRSPEHNLRVDFSTTTLMALP